MKLLSRLEERYSDICKTFLFILSIVLIVLQFPHEGKFKYEFQKSKPWMHEDLIAPFDFAILKSDDSIATEKAAAYKSMKPYFSVNNAVKVEKVKSFRKEFDLKWAAKYGEKNGKRYKLNYKTALSIIDTVYKKGIIQLNDTLDNKAGDYVINIVTGNIAEEKELSELFNIQTADDYIVAMVNKKFSIDKELLLSLLENTISQNVFYDENITGEYKQNIINNISITRGMVQKGERIISKGELVTAEKFYVIESMKKEYESQIGSSSKYYRILLGQIVLVCISIIVLLLFLMSFRKDILYDNKKVFFILLIIFFMVLLTSTVIKLDVKYLYLVPLCIIPVIIRVFFDTRLALFVHLVTIIIIGFLVPNSFEFVFLQLIAGIIAIVSIVNLRKRSQFFYTTILIFTTYSATYTGITLMQEGSLANINSSNFIWFAGSSFFILFSYPLIFVFEKIFGFATDVSLMELSDINSRLLRQLSSKAPATLQHSLQVANLSEEAIYVIGGNTLLVRAGALYHDIGKMDMPLYFTENQSAGINPHDELTSEESAAIIISHVIKGIELAKKYNLPERIIDFIRTHHGTRKTLYFYNQFIRNNPGEPVNESKFTYHGPIPFSKETAVLMMADAVEAVSRTLKKTDEEAINTMVENVINMQIEQKQFMNSDITFSDVALVKKIFKKKLLNMFHVRIEYPA
ncbi:MAG: HDIG domain-containing metalloprotein [Bacteroidales bacterium]